MLIILRLSLGKERTKYGYDNRTKVCKFNKTDLHIFLIIPICVRCRKQKVENHNYTIEKNKTKTAFCGIRLLSNIV